MRPDFRRVILPAGINISGLPWWSRALQDMRRGLKNPRLLILADSTGAGFGSPTNGSFVGSLATCWPNVVQSIINASSRFSSKNAYFWNDANVTLNGFTLPQYDSRVTLQTGWASNSSVCFGGNLITDSTTPNAIIFAPGILYDTIEVYWCNAGSGSFSVDNGGAILGTLSNGGGLNYSSQTFSVAPGSTAINLKGVGGQPFVLGVNVYLSGQKSIHFFNSSASGYTLDNTLNGSSGLGAGVNLSILKPDLTIICLTINDWNAGTNTTTFQTGTQTLITNAKASGDVLLMTGVPSNTSIVAQATQDSYTAVYKTLAALNAVPLIDMKAQWTSWTVANSAGLMSDNLHPNQTGYGPGIPGILGISQLIYNRIMLGI